MACEGEDVGERILQLRIERVAQSLLGAKQSRLHRGCRDFQRLSGLLDAQALDLAQHENQPEARRQLGHRTLEPVPYDANQLGDMVEQLRPPHIGTRPIGNINWTMDESRGLVTRRPGWLKIIMTIVLRYYFDIGQRMKTGMDRRLTEAARRLASGESMVTGDNAALPEWFPQPDGGDEVSELTQAFRYMVQEVAIREQRLQQHACKPAAETGALPAPAARSHGVWLPVAATLVTVSWACCEKEPPRTLRMSPVLYPLPPPARTARSPPPTPCTSPPA